MNEAEALTTLLSNSPLAAAVLFLGYKAKSAFDRVIKSIENAVETSKEATAANTLHSDSLESHGEQLEENTQALIENTQARKAAKEK
ncbi:MAG: hypothetical protein V3V10_09400 [Planctomycetota bacterium]